MRNTVFDTWSNSCYTLYVGNLDCSLSKDDIARIFEQYGRIQEIDMPAQPANGHKNSKFCFIKFDRWESVVLCADNMNGICISGKSLRVEQAPKYKN